MPPNRKTDLSSQDFASLDVAHIRALKVEATPVTLSAPQAAQQQQQPPSYWDWPVDQEVKELQCLDTTHIESNLQKESQRLQRKQQSSHDGTVRSQQRVVEDSDSYWDMPTLPKDVVVKPRTTPRRLHHHPAPTGIGMSHYWDDGIASDDYWNDPSISHYRVKPQKKRPVPTHHAAPAHLDKETYWSETASPVATKVDSDAYWNDPAESHNQPSYWDWSPTQLEDDNAMRRELALQAKLERERAHRLTSAGFLEKQLLEQAAKVQAQSSCQQQAAGLATTTTIQANDDYWAC